MVCREGCVREFEWNRDTVNQSLNGGPGILVVGKGTWLNPQERLGKDPEHPEPSRELPGIPQPPRPTPGLPQPGDLPDPPRPMDPPPQGPTTDPPGPAPIKMWQD